MEINFKAVPPEDYFSTEDSNLIISTAHIIPHGVIRMSNIYEGFVETSNNFAIVDEEEEGILFWLYPRSIIRDELDSFCVSMLQLGKLGGWEMYLRPVLPEWLPDLNSSFLAFVKEIYEDILQEPVKTNVVHGGLETGTISKKLPGIEMVALCPRIEGNHSPNERLNISDVGMIYRLLKKVLLEFSRLK